MNLLLKIVIISWGLALATAAAPANAPGAVAEASKAGQFLFLTFYEAKDAVFNSLATAVKSFKGSASSKTASFEARSNEPASKELMNKFGIQDNDLPVLLVIAPNGAITGGYGKTVTAEQLKQSTGVSGLVLKTLKPLQEQKITLVALQNKTTQLNGESMYGVNDFYADPKYGKFVEVVTADPAAPESQDFLKQCGLLNSMYLATVVILLPPGRIGKILTGKVSKNDILGALAACSGGSCGPGSCAPKK